MNRTKVALLGLLLTLGLFVQTTTAQYRSTHLPMDGRVANSARVPLLHDESATVPLVEQVGAIGMTVSDMDTSVDFYSRVLSFEKVSDVEVTGEDYERLQGVFGLRMRVVRMRLGDEFIELTEYLTPKGRPVPVDSRSNDRWFQHIAIITSDMDKAYSLLRQNKV
ncbi:MAG TPA: VOC family protein [Pyrinomonadaceae bacterium]|nr:VOC family protein [Pyrinomonadaceae bacterium]